jgi:amino-acid N-acetyltransferase
MPVKIEKAQPADIDPIYQIIKSYSDDDVVLERSRDEISASLETFFVARGISKIEGVISYYDYGPGLKEVRSLCVSKENLRKGTGSLLLKKLVDEIRRKNRNTKIFVLTYNPLFFMKNSFVEVEKNSLPEKIWKDCDNCKNRDDCGETAMIHQ